MAHVLGAFWGVGIGYLKPRLRPQNDEDHISE